KNQAQKRVLQDVNDGNLIEIGQVDVIHIDDPVAVGADEVQVWRHLRIVTPAAFCRGCNLVDEVEFDQQAERVVDRHQVHGWEVGAQRRVDVRRGRVLFIAGQIFAAGDPLRGDLGSGFTQALNETVLLRIYGFPVNPGHGTPNEFL